MFKILKIAKSMKMNALKGHEYINIGQSPINEGQLTTKPALKGCNCLWDNH